MLEEIKEAAQFIQKSMSLHPTIGIILGTGLGALAEEVEVDIVRVEEPEESGIEESELDEMWSYVGKKTNPRWREACH